MFTDALDYCTYRLASRDQMFNDRIAQRFSKVQKRLMVQMRNQVFNASDPSSILSFMRAFKTNSDSYVTSECSAIWFINYFMGKLPNETLFSRLYLKSLRS